MFFIGTFLRHLAFLIETIMEENIPLFAVTLKVEYREKLVLVPRFSVIQLSGFWCRKIYQPPVNRIDYFNLESLIDTLAEDSRAVFLSKEKVWKSKFSTN